MTFRDEYKLFHRLMRRFDLRSSLEDVWRYSLHVTEHQPLPADYAVGKDVPKPLNELVFGWGLDLLARELVLNATRMGTRSLRNWRHLAGTIDCLTKLEELAFLSNGDPENDVMIELHRLAHRQFPWQTDLGVRPMMRALKVFGEAAVDAIVNRELGMTMRQFMTLGLAVNGNFLTNWGMSTNQDYRALGISRDASDAFFKRITCTMEELKAETARRQSYDSDWLYTWNPLEGTPLVRYDPNLPDYILCPIPRYLTRRVAGGIFYDLVNSANFDNSFGSSFQAYTGEVIGMICPPPRFTAWAEEPYHVGRQRKDGVDWVLSDSTGHLFFECKTKRLTLNAKTLSDPLALHSDITTMAKAVVQHYQNILDALEGKTRWVPDGLPVFPLILTLEDWLIFSPQVDEALDSKVRALMAKVGVPARFLEDMPYTIASVHEFEIAGQIIAQVGVCEVMRRKTEGERHRWSLLPFLYSEFSGEMRNVNWRLFDDEWAKWVGQTTRAPTC